MMATQDEYLARYEAIAVLSGQMLAAARNADWPELGGLQEAYLQLVDGLKEVPGVDLSESERRRKYELLRRILADDAAIRDLASPEMARLSMLLEAGRSTEVLKNMYRARR